MSNFRAWIFTFCMVQSLVLRAEFTLKGQIHVDSVWEPIVYLSLIPSFEELHTVSQEMIVAWARIDTDGNFVLKGDHLPEEDQFYRLHVSKKGDPAATIIIGGREENFRFLVLNNHAQCHLEDTSMYEKQLIQAYVNCYPNLLLSEVDHMVSFEESINSEFTFGKELMEYALYEKLRQFADTTNHPLIALYALYQTPWNDHIQEHADYYRRLIQKWKWHPSNHYFNTLSANIPKATSLRPIWVYVLIGTIFGILLGWISYFIYMQHRILSKQTTPELQPTSRTDLYQLLSVQERKIFDSIKMGNTNKDIATEMHIEVSTVKSHVRNIYSKLGINSRREAMNFESVSPAVTHKNQGH